jgi:hypothetical protein
MNLRTPLATMTAMNTPGGGRRIVLVAPLTEIIDHAGFFIQMSLASLPVWMEGSESPIYSRANPTSSTTIAPRALMSNSKRIDRRFVTSSFGLAAAKSLSAKR